MHEYTVESPRESRSAQNMARFYFACFWTIVFTGAIRKWMFPGNSILYLTQDVPIGLAYLYAIRTGLLNRGYLLLGILFLSFVLFLQGLFQIVAGGLEPFVAFVGFHNYLFYLPILVVFPLVLTEKYRKDFIRWNLLFSLPMCLLAIAQATFPKQAFINRTSEGGDAFGVPGAEIARVTGTFNFTSFYGIWVAMAVALCVGEWLLPNHRRSIQRQWLLILCTIAVNLCHLISASRSAIALAAIAVLGGMVAAVVLGSNRALLAIVGILLSLPVAAGLTYSISPAEFNIIVDRFTGENYQSSSQSRVLEGLAGFLYEPKFSLIGAGIGQGVDAAHVGSAQAYDFTYALSESDLVRNVMELGTPVGIFYALCRIGFCVGMLLLAYRIVRSGTSPHVMPLAFFLIAQAYPSELTRNAAQSASQVMVGYAFILGAYFNPDYLG